MPKVPVEYQNHPPPPSKENPGSRKTEHLSSWRRGPSDLPKLTGRLANIRQDSEQFNRFKECLERAGMLAAAKFERDIRSMIPLGDLEKTICQLVLEGQLDAWHNRVPGAEPPEELLQHVANYASIVRDKADTIYRALGQHVTAHVYWFMWNAIAATLQWPRDSCNTGDFQATYKFYTEVTSAARSEYDKAYDKAFVDAINATNRSVAYVILDRSAPDYWDASGLAGDPTSLRLALLDVAGERHEWETVGELAKEAGIAISKEDHADIVWAAEIIKERRWWGSPVPVHYINRAAANDRADRKKAEWPENLRAAAAFADQNEPWKVFSLDDPQFRDENGESKLDTAKEEVISRADSMGAEEREQLLRTFRRYMRPDARVYFDLKHEELRPRKTLREQGWSEARMDAAKRSYDRTVQRVALILKDRPLKGAASGSNLGVFREYLDANGPLTTGRPWTYTLKASTSLTSHQAPNKK